VSGNVWEWCSTKWVDNYKNYDKKTKDRENLEGNDPRVLRGGAFNNDENGVRAACRDRVGPVNGYGGCGFRVVAGAS
jgi:formylglycine-generating enzyme required for sulfatase activity